MTETAEVYVFGTGELSALARYCIEHDSDSRVAGFFVDREFRDSERFEGLPVLAFEELAAGERTPALRLVLPTGNSRINGVRRDRYERARSLGFEFLTWVSSRASTWPDLVLGENCLVYEGAVVQPFTRIGDNVIVRSGAHLSHHNVIEDHCFIAAGATLGGNVHVGCQSFVGLGAVVRDGVRLAERTFVGAGAVVLGNTEADGVYVGNPARKLDKSSAEVTAVRRR